MVDLELLAPARNADIGIAAIDCGADAVYIAGPSFGARKDAGNPMEEVARLCDYAHRFGARIFLTVNIELRDDELDEVHAQMLEAQKAGVDAFIFRDLRIAGWKDITVPLHASTQCAIRTVEKARAYDSAGCARIVLERELSLERIREICSSVSCEVEFFVHGALCVCYSGECRLSEQITGRSADRGECIQACRSLYDLVDADGKVLVRNKALLSLKDYNLRNRIAELADAGVCSFKIEGRLKNSSYVRNVVRDYSLALDDLVARHPGKYRRASFGRVEGGFTPDTAKTFNRGYTELYLDGKRGKWSSMDAPKSMGEAIGTVKSVRQRDRFSVDITVQPSGRSLDLHNGDGFAFVTKDNIVGFRADICYGNTITCKSVQGLQVGTLLYRNINTAFEKSLESNPCRREIPVSVDVTISDGFRIVATAVSQDGRTASAVLEPGNEAARNRERSLSMLKEGLSKRSGIYSFMPGSVEVSTEEFPLISSAAVNGLRRELADKIDSQPCISRKMAQGQRTAELQEAISRYSIKERPDELMRSKYCIRYELGLCPVHQGAKSTGPLYLLNNSRRFALGFDCKACEMTLTQEQK